MVSVKRASLLQLQPYNAHLHLFTPKYLMAFEVIGDLCIRPGGRGFVAREQRLMGDD